MATCQIDGLFRCIGQARRTPCPRGGPELTTAVPDGALIAELEAAATRRLTARLAVCRNCDRYNGAQCEALGGCLARWQDTLRAAAPACPDRRWET